MTKEQRIIAKVKILEIFEEYHNYIISDDTPEEITDKILDELSAIESEQEEKGMIITVSERVEEIYCILFNGHPSREDAAKNQ